jgi:hypothetical protein
MTSVDFTNTKLVLRLLNFSVVAAPLDCSLYLSAHSASSL